MAFEHLAGWTPFRETASALVVTGPGHLDHVTISFDEAATATINLYDALSATGTPVYTVVTQGGVNDEALKVPCNFGFATGLYVEIANAAAVCGSYV